MEYKHDLFKIIHFDGIENIVEFDPELTPQLKLVTEPSPVFEDKLPMTFLWTFRILKNEDIVVSYIAEDKYLIDFDDTEELKIYLELVELIDHSHMVFCNEWEIKTKNTSCEKVQITMFDFEEKLRVASKITDLARMLSLL